MKSGSKESQRRNRVGEEVDEVPRWLVSFGLLIDSRKFLLLSLTQSTSIICICICRGLDVLYRMYG